MAKKAVAKFSADKGTNKKSVMCIRMDRADRSGAYAFRQEMVPVEEVKEFFKN